MDQLLSQNFIEQLGLPAQAIAEGMGDTLARINFIAMRCAIARCDLETQAAYWVTVVCWFR
jgi:hypothetical protein